jgi:hypothetical protein
MTAETPPKKVRCRCRARRHDKNRARVCNRWTLPKPWMGDDPEWHATCDDCVDNPGCPT